MLTLSLPPSVTVSRKTVDISVITDDGATVLVALPNPRGFHDLPESEVAERARRLARTALIRAAQSLQP